RTVVAVDLKRPANDQPVPLHNRWHPDVPSVATVEVGETFKVECLDWTGGQIKNDDSAEDVRVVDLTQVHHLS
ncbi:Acetamidase/Formamidase, partial [Blyttiomyces helicus]